MVPEVGWVLDVYTEDDLAFIWIRTEDNKVVRLQDHYHPSLTFFLRHMKMVNSFYPPYRIRWT
ncbi:MAG: hypothetical protein ABSB40_08195 [Nitrososphaeria archaeon]|jgi:hypothetical protein